MDSEGNFDKEAANILPMDSTIKGSEWGLLEIKLDFPSNGSNIVTKPPRAYSILLDTQTQLFGGEHVCALLEDNLSRYF